MKRPAGAGASGASKRAARDPINIKCATIAAALGKAEDLPENVRDMLADMVPSSLSVVEAERHPFQTKTVEMVEEAFAGMGTKLQVALAEAQTKVDGAETEKATRIAAAEAAQAGLSDCESKSIAGRETSQVDAAALKQAKADVVSAHAAQEKTEADLAETAEQQATLAAAAEVFGSIRGERLCGREGSKAFDKVSGALEGTCRAENSLVNALHATLKKEPKTRGSFDTIIEQNALNAFTLTAAELQQSLTASGSTKAAAAAATAAAEAAAVAAAEKSTASQDAFDVAVVAMRSAEDALSEAKEAVENFDEESKEAASSLEKAKASLAAFQEGPRTAFMELKSLALPAEAEDAQDAAGEDPEGVPAEE